MRFVITLTAGFVVIVLLLALSRASPTDTRTVRVLRQFAFLEFWLVVLPWFVLSLTRLIPPVTWLAGVFGSVYYLPPRIIFGGAHFRLFHDALFPDVIGMAQTAAFYSAIALLLSLLRLLPSRGNDRSKAPAA